MTDPLLFEPIYQERVWGGSAFGTAFGRKVPAEIRIGESWEVVDRPEAASRVAAGRWKGKTLRQLIEERPEAVMGPGYDPQRPFPILVKWLDCQERLSLQVHPPAEVARRLTGEPKTENWYVAGASGESQLLVGLKSGVTRADFERAMEENRLEACIHRFASREGTSILVRSGQVHAIDAGNLILEVQQNSDTTYRVYDWGRVGLDGAPRRLHIAESLESIDFDDIEPMPRAPEEGDALLAECPEFTLRQYRLARGRQISFAAGEQPRLLHVVSGRPVIRSAGGELQAAAGDNFLLPFEAEAEVTAAEEGRLLVTEDFCGDPDLDRLTVTLRG